jgi:uncharacterized membrane protein YhiD involved in acid resistance
MLLFVAAAAATLHAQTPLNQPGDDSLKLLTIWEQVRVAMIRLPIAAVLGAALALRPRRRGAPDRKMSVVETQIVLAVVGALVMVVVGASLARAFGIVGAANLVRYRAKVEDPKDAVVMLTTLSVGLAAGVGLYALAAVGTLFVAIVLWSIEMFEPEAREPFELTVRVKDGDITALRPRVEAVLAQNDMKFEIRATADDAVTYAIDAPATLGIESVTSAIELLGPKEGFEVAWGEKKPKKVS